MFNHVGCVSPKSPAGPVFLISVEARKEKSHCTSLTSGPFPVLLQYRAPLGNLGSNKEAFKGLIYLSVLSPAEQEREQVEIWGTTVVPEPKSYLDIILSLQSKVFKSVAPFHLPALLLPSSAHR